MSDWWYNEDTRIGLGIVKGTGKVHIEVQSEGGGMDVSVCLNPHWREAQKLQKLLAEIVASAKQEEPANETPTG